MKIVRIILNFNGPLMGLLNSSRDGKPNVRVESIVSLSDPIRIVALKDNSLKRVASHLDTKFVFV